MFVESIPAGNNNIENVLTRRGSRDLIKIALKATILL